MMWACLRIYGGYKPPEVPIIWADPTQSFSMAQFMNKYFRISAKEIMSRIKDAPDPVEEGLSIASETIKELMKLSRGVHIMPVGSHKNTPRLLSMAGILGND